MTKPNRARGRAAARATALLKLPGERIAELRDVFDETDQDRGSGRRIRRVVVADTLRRMRIAETIGEQQYLAGHMFRADFQRAHLTGIKPAALEKIDQSGGSDDHLSLVEICGRRVFRDLRAVGGLGSVSASVLWDVVGCEKSLRDWGELHGKNHHLVAGILVGALDVIAVSRGLIQRGNADI
jgi:hypothetical protein